MATINPALEKAFNEQIIHESANANLYRNMEAAFHLKGLDGFAKFCHDQADGELEHAKKFAEHVSDRNGQAVFGAIPLQPSQWADVTIAMEGVYQREQETTQRIQDLYDLAVKLHDYGAQEFLDWFAAEQVEEERTAYVLLQRVKLIGDDRGALVLFDNELEG